MSATFSAVILDSASVSQIGRYQKNPHVKTPCGLQKLEMTSRITETSLNRTTNIPEFIIQGFAYFPDKYDGILGTCFFCLYLMLAFGNIFIILFVTYEKCLQRPTYIIFCNLAASDLGFGTTTLPTIIGRYWTSQAIISFNGCMTQMFFVHFLGSATSFLLGLMALDRFVAICNPLRYPTLIKNSTIANLSLVSWIINLLVMAGLTAHLLTATYCGPNVIAQCYCDHISLRRLACGDISSIKATITPVALTILWGPFCFIIFSYVAIIYSVMQISSKEARYKTFITCTPQLVIICLYYLPRTVVYLSQYLGFYFNNESRILITLIYSLFPALMNPFIYCFRTKEIKERLMMRLKQRRVIGNVKNVAEKI
ncbi:olfactory receptor 10A3-like [Trichomycterus rosablanca]|uniref:olfactory receptor 10A3-like n=1 Tax=Trichomycterus rosablanca TaxID=2290929 RepID=UPI002F35B0F1